MSTIEVTVTVTLALACVAMLCWLGRQVKLAIDWVAGDTDK